MHDDLGPLYRGFDPLARGQVALHKLDALTSLAAAPAEYLYLTASALQQRDEQATERARAAGDQNTMHGSFLSSYAVLRMPLRNCLKRLGGASRSNSNRLSEAPTGDERAWA